MIISIAALLLPMLFGLLITLYFLNWKRISYLQLFLAASLGSGLGQALSSVVFFLWLLFFGAVDTAYVVMDFVLFSTGSIVIAYMLRRRVRLACPLESFKVCVKSKQNLIALICMVAILSAFILLFISKSIAQPYGAGDGLLIWNMHARYLFRGHDQWLNMFSVINYHPEYPLLLPCVVARAWICGGWDSPLIPIFVAFFYALSTVTLLVCFITWIRGAGFGILAGIVLICTTQFSNDAARQQADIPIGLYFLMSMVFYCLSNGERKGLLILAGLTAGLSSWTKNEGFAFVLSIIVVRFLIAIRNGGFKAYLREIAWFSLGAAPVLIMTIYFQTRLAPTEYVAASLDLGNSSGHLIEFARNFKILKTFLYGFATFGNGVFPALILFLLISGMMINREYKTGQFTVCGVILLMIACYYIIYILTTSPLDWHLRTSLTRLILQLWPAIILAVFMTVRIPKKTAGTGM